MEIFDQEGQPFEKGWNKKLFRRRQSDQAAACLSSGARYRVLALKISCGGFFPINAPIYLS